MALENIDKERLKTIIRARSYRQGDITLASGKKSKFYFDLKPTMLDPQGSVLLAEAFLEKLQHYEIDYVGGLELGAVPLTAIVVSRSHIMDDPVSGFVVRKEAKEHGTQKRIEGLTLDESLSGKRVAVLEDVTTTGTSAGLVVELLTELGANVVVVVTAIDRQDGAREFFESKNIPFESIFTPEDFNQETITMPLMNIWDWQWWWFK